MRAEGESAGGAAEEESHVGETFRQKDLCLTHLWRVLPQEATKGGTPIGRILSGKGTGDRMLLLSLLIWAKMEVLRWEA